MAVTRIWWVRHGPTHQTTMVGWRDVPADLSDTGLIARLNACLPPGAPVLSSDLLRARQTADALSHGRPRLPDDPALREFDYGDWDGMGWQDIAAGWPDLSRQYWERPGDVAPPNGESWNGVAARVSSAIDARLGKVSDLIVVAHMGVILTQIARARRQTPVAVLAQPVAALSVTCLRHGPGGWQADMVNHLP